MCTHVYTYIYIFRYHEFPSIPPISVHPPGSFLPSPITYLYVPTFTMRTLAPNNINTCTHLLTSIIYLQ